MLTLLPSVATGEKILMLCVGTGSDGQLLAAGREPPATLPSEYPTAILNIIRMAG